MDRTVEAFRERLEAKEFVTFLEQSDPIEVGRTAADFAVARHRSPGPVADRIGAVYGTDALARYLAPAGRSLTTEAVRKRAKQRHLVAFVTGDGQWAFPAWQFVAVSGRLEPVDAVIEVWRRLPHDGVMDAADLAMWMNTRLRSLDGTPANRARTHGIGDRALGRAVARLSARVGDRAA